MRFIRTEGVNDPTPSVDDYREHYHKGYGSWWSAFVPSGGTGYVNWRWSHSFTVAQKSYERMFEFGIGRHLQSGELLRRGDVIYYRLKEPFEEFTHSAIVSRVTKRGVYVAQYTANYENKFTDVTLRLNSNPDYDGWSYEIVRPTRRAYDLDQ